MNLESIHEITNLIEEVDDQQGPNEIPNTLQFEFDETLKTISQKINLLPEDEQKNFTTILEENKSTFEELKALSLASKENEIATAFILFSHDIENFIVENRAFFPETTESTKPQIEITDEEIDRMLSLLLKEDYFIERITKWATGQEKLDSWQHFALSFTKGFEGTGRLIINLFTGKIFRNIQHLIKFGNSKEAFNSFKLGLKVALKNTDGWQKAAILSQFTTECINLVGVGKTLAVGNDANMLVRGAEFTKSLNNEVLFNLGRVGKIIEKVKYFKPSNYMKGTTSRSIYYAGSHQTFSN